jgi:hypothetical protein
MTAPTLYEAWHKRLAGLSCCNDISCIERALARCLSDPPFAIRCCGSRRQFPHRSPGTNVTYPPNRLDKSDLDIIPLIGHPRRATPRGGAAPE